MTAPIAIAGSGGADIPYSAWGAGTTRGLSGSATIFAPAASISAWQWTLLSKPTGSSASLTGATTQTPTLIDIDQAGNYEIGLVVTDNTAQVSESDPFLMPDSARVTVKALTRYAEIYVQAEGQRNYSAERELEVLRQDALAVVPFFVPIQVIPGDFTKYNIVFGPCAGEVLYARFSCKTAPVATGSITATLLRSGDDEPISAPLNLDVLGGDFSIIPGIDWPSGGDGFTIEVISTDVADTTGVALYVQGNWINKGY